MDTPVKPGFGKLLLAIFCPPLYFFTRGKITAGVIHSAIYALALLTLIFGIGVFFWLVGMLHAFWDFGHLKQELLIQRQATVIAEKMAQKPVGSGSTDTQA